MEKRCLPYVAKITPELLQLVSQAADTRMFLLQELGPTKFIYETEDNTKYKVEIGQIAKCSCNSTQSHCIHIVPCYTALYSHQNIQY